MEKACQALKRIPRIKFPERHPIPNSSSSSGSKPAFQSLVDENAEIVTFFSSVKEAPMTVGGKASLQPKRTSLSNEEIEAILVPTMAL